MSRKDYNLAARFLLHRKGEDNDKYQSQMDNFDDVGASDALGRLQDAGYDVSLNRCGDWDINGPVSSSPDIVTPRTKDGSASATTIPPPASLRFRMWNETAGDEDEDDLGTVVHST
jgi:hypothetical protein